MQKTVMRFMNHFPSPRTSNRDRGFLGSNPWRSDFFDDDISVPAMNVSDSENKFEVDIIAPGMSKEDFEIKIRDHMLHVTAERKIEKEHSGDYESDYYHREYFYQSFSRSYALPDFINEEKVSAAYEDGVLKIEFPKKENQHPNKVKTISIS